MIRIEHLSLRYAGADDATINDLSLTVEKGESVLICGPTGCGKSSLINCMNGVLHHESAARIGGRVFVDGQDIRNLSLPEMCTWVGTVFQNPDSQICTSTPETEIAFGLENQCLNRTVMKARIDEVLSYTGLEDCRHQSTLTLSGGQKQRLVIACALALKPKILFLDEPVSQLDPKGAEEILSLVNRLKQDHAYTIVLIEHRIEETFAQADRIIVMGKGGVVSDSAPADTLRNIHDMRSLGIKLPHLPDFFDRINRPERPLTIEHAPIVSVRSHTAAVSHKSDPCLCDVNELTFGYTKNEHVLRNLSVQFHQGERVALMGTNGAGKSTLLHVLAGAHKPLSGSVVWAGDSGEKGLVLQSPDLMLFSETVKEECLFAPIHQGMTRVQASAVADTVLGRLGLSDFASAAPFALSKGQRLRVAVGSVLSKQPSVLLLDEPTTGQDREHIEKLMSRLENDFGLVVFCTHDVDTAARHANRVILLHHGTIVANGHPSDVFHHHEALATASIRQTTIQQYAVKLGTRALCVEELVSLVE
jgi:energy-coupling factor transport system ATP-binding protein